ncbi:MAG: hypothetical protein LBR71_01425 [Synergistaceae bacterium]|jgi:hypothetical protein|nr:hypothetical protein [Synergistaceae bacterium]
MDDALLLFDSENPCWTKALIELAGGEPASLDGLLQRGLLGREEEVYFLTQEGAEAFRNAAEASFLPLRPGALENGADRRRLAKRVELRLLLDKRHLQRWGVKEFRSPFRFEIPDLTEEELFAVQGESQGESQGGSLVWRYPLHPAFAAMERNFPTIGLAARKIAPPSPERLTEWMRGNAPRRRFMEADLLYKSRYDFLAYARFPSLPCDPCGLLNTDRFLFFFPPKPENRNALLTILGEFHIFLTMLRRMVLPGYVDLDSLDQDGINWLFYVYEHEEDALECAALLSPFGKALAGPAAPLDVWTLSLGALWRRDETAETVHDLLPFAAHPIWRAE